MPGQRADSNNREKEIKLLHLDHLQRGALEVITNKFFTGSKITISEIVDAFGKYIVDLANLASMGEKHLCEINGRLTPLAEDHLKKFTDAILICSKCFINYNKVFESQEVKNSFMKAIEPSKGFRSHYKYELEYNVKITTYNMLEADRGKAMDYASNIEDFYYRSLVAVNPASAKRSFIDHIVSMVCYKSNYTMSDIVNTMEKYVKYLGKTKLNQDKLETLIHKYSNASARIHDGLLHGAKVEVFKILEGL